MAMYVFQVSADTDPRVAVDLPNDDAAYRHANGLAEALVLPVEVFRAETVVRLDTVQPPATSATV